MRTCPEQFQAFQQGGEILRGRGHNSWDGPQHRKGRWVSHQKKVENRLKFILFTYNTITLFTLSLYIVHVFQINERESDKSRHIPALTCYKSLRSAGMLDITNNKTRFWLQTKLKQLVSSYNVDALYLDLGRKINHFRTSFYRIQKLNPYFYLRFSV